jgi:transcriptional regulator with XRE-family HTH domain
MSRFDVGERLRFWRAANGWSQSRAAEFVGAKQPMWSEWEKGTRRPGSEFRERIEKLTSGVISFGDWNSSEAA